MCNKQTDVPVKCLQPVVIFNPKLEYYFNNIEYIHLLDSNLYNYYKNISHLKKSLYLSKKQCNYDNINNYYCITIDGEIIPLFILVRCNKCLLCKQHYSKMWQFRGIAESNSSKNKTYFVTLTYNDRFKPKYGVDIRAIQLFIKRLRNNLDKLNIQHSLKYFAVGEYGSNTLRPHYHLILWNFPDNNPYFTNTTKILNFIEKSWSIYDFDTQLFNEIGYAYCKPCDSGSLSYVMKYVKKNFTRVPKNCNPIFYTCSKYIGYDYFINNYEYLKSNPSLITLSINDNISNEVFTSPYPTYYRNKLMPNTSQIFPKEILDTYRYCLTLHDKINTLNYLQPSGYSPSETLFNYYTILFDYDNTKTIHPLNERFIDHYYFSYNSTFYNYQIDVQIKNLQSQLNTYLSILQIYYDKHIKSLINSRALQLQRKIKLDKLPNKCYTLDFLRIENEKIQNTTKKSLKKEKI